MAKKFHPDKVSALSSSSSLSSAAAFTTGDSSDPSSSANYNKTHIEQANEMFNKCKLAYDVLSDPVKKEYYDRTGIIPGLDDGSSDSSQNFWHLYEKLKSVKITEDDIKKYEQDYKGSSSERADLIEYFNSNKGDVSRILEYIIGSGNDDRERFVKIFEEELSLNESNDNPDENDVVKIKIDKSKSAKKAFQKSKSNILSVEELEAEAVELDDDAENEEDEYDDEEMYDEEEEEKDRKFIADDDEIGEEEAGEEEEQQEDEVLEHTSKRKLEKAKDKKEENDIEIERKRSRSNEKQPKGQAKIEKDDEIDDMDALRRAILQKGKQREDSFKAFEDKFKRSKPKGNKKN